MDPEIVSLCRLNCMLKTPSCNRYARVFFLHVSVIHDVGGASPVWSESGAPKCVRGGGFLPGGSCHYTQATMQLISS